jgi:phage terminase large subunit GpA-like protein
LEWGAKVSHGIKWDRGPNNEPVRGSLRYVCRENGCEISEHFKTKMLEGGKWVAHSQKADGRTRGFKLSSLYSPLGWLSWFELAQEWHRATVASANGDQSLLRVFINTRLAETYDEDAGEKTDQHVLRKRAQDIPLGVVQWGHYIRTAGVDVQGDRLELYDWAWGRGMSRQLVAKAVFYGDPAIPEDEPLSPWTQLTEYREAQVLHASGTAVELACVMIDSGGHHTQQVYVYARNHRHERVHAVKGVSIANRPILGKPSDQDINHRGDKIKGGVKLWQIGTDTAKSEIYGRLRISEPGPGYVLFSKHLPDEVFAQITSERLTTKYVKGRAKLEWTKPAASRNEALDCAVYALAGAHWVGIDRWRGEWASLQRHLEPELEPAGPPQLRPQRRRIRGRIKH